jgi:hypothetical protein
MSNEEIGRHAPSILADVPHHSRKENYGFVPTTKVIDALRGEGFEVFEVSQRKTRILDRVPFTKHMVRMRHRNSFGINEVPELIFTNSHDGSSSYDLMNGIFRFICSNGLIAGDIFGSYKVRHMGDIVADVIEGTYKVMESTKEITNRIDTYKTVNLNWSEQIEFASAARAIVWGVTAPVTSADLLMYRRHEDAGTDMWRVLNRVQENIVRGGIQGMSANRRRITTRGINSINRDVEVNKALWNLADRFALDKVPA